MQCHACNFTIELAAGERVGFRDCCDHCGADLHVCSCCAHHDPSAYNECRESGSERVSQRDRANRCDWFAASDRQGGGRAGGRQESLNDLESLFKKT
jgi:hypothetical protein